MTTPHIYLITQVSRIWLGFFLTTAYCWVLSHLASYPPQSVAVCVCALGYFFLWELMYCGWRGIDTMEATLFILLGASSYLFIDMQWVINRLALSFIIACSILLVCALMRAGKDE